MCHAHNRHATEMTKIWLFLQSNHSVDYTEQYSLHSYIIFIVCVQRQQKTLELHDYNHGAVRGPGGIPPFPPPAKIVMSLDRF